MRPVFQDRFGYNNGSCAWACLASIFELPLAIFASCYPPHDADLKKWSECAVPHLEFHYRDLRTNYRMLYTPYVGLKWTYDPVTEFEPPTQDYWLATVHSNAVKSPPESDWWPNPGLHAVVMKGAEFIHDPNPAYQGMPLPPVCAASWWTTRNAPQEGSDLSAGR